MLDCWGGGDAYVLCSPSTHAMLICLLPHNHPPVLLVLQLEYGADLTIGPALEEGFYYDCFLGSDKALSLEAERGRITKRMQQVRIGRSCAGVEGGWGFEL